jgi:phenylalanyl-tRNA synthetase beta chain
VAVRNPVSAEHAVLRPLLLPSLLAAVARNVALGRADAALFEVSHVFRRTGEGMLPHEPWTLGGVLHGRLGGGGWRRSGPAVDYFVAKGVLAALLRPVGLELEVVRGDDPFLHPGRAARVLLGGQDAGFVGELHPAVAERYELAGPVAAFELDLEVLVAALPPAPTEAPVADLPPLRQDIAVVVPDEHPAAALVAAARAAGGGLLASVEVFDVYRDAAALGADRRSVALRLTFQAGDRTLTDAEVDPLRRAIVSALEERFGAVLRGG